MEIKAILNLDWSLLWKILKLDTKVVSQIGTRESLEIAVFEELEFLYRVFDPLESTETSGVIFTNVSTRS